jgi:signal peptidase I
MQNTTMNFKYLTAILGTLVIAIAVAVTPKIFPTYTIAGVSMMPTIKPQSTMMATAIFFDISRNDIVIINQDKINSEIIHPDGPYIKRIVGLPGDTLTFNMNNGVVVAINDHKVNYTRAPQYQSFSLTSKSPDSLGATFTNHAFNMFDGNATFPVYIPEDQPSPSSELKIYKASVFNYPWLTKQASGLNGIVTITVPENHYFALSDNGVSGTDSRHFGPVHKSAVLHKIKKD